MSCQIIEFKRPKKEICAHDAAKKLHEIVKAGSGSSFKDEATLATVVSDPKRNKKYFAVVCKIEYAILDEKGNLSSEWLADHLFNLKIKFSDSTTQMKIMEYLQSVNIDFNKK